MRDRAMMHRDWSPRRRGHPASRLALPLAAFGAARLAGRRRGQHGPSTPPFVLPLALFGAARLLRGGPFGLGLGPHDRPGRFGGEDDGEGHPFGGRPPFRFPFGGFPGGPFGRGPRARRGDVRAGILALLAEEPRNGYQIIQELGQRSGGAWRPSPGSVYPALQQLEDEGLIRAEERDGKRTFGLTEAGKAYVESHREEVTTPWDAMAEGLGNNAREVGGLIQQVAMAAMQVLHAGNGAQIGEARKVLIGARRSLYRILAEDAPGEGGDTPEGVGRA